MDIFFAKKILLSNLGTMPKSYWLSVFVCSDSSDIVWLNADENKCLHSNIIPVYQSYSFKFSSEHYTYIYIHTL